MAQHSKIEWTGKTWNPVRGCSKISPGCKLCYAARQAARFSGIGRPFHGFAIFSDSGPQWTGHVELCEDKLEEPKHIKRFVRKNRGLIRARAVCQVSDRARVRGSGRCGIRRIFSW